MRNDVLESDTCTDPDSCSDMDFDADIDDSLECTRGNDADGNGNMDVVGTNGIDNSFDTDTAGVCDNNSEGDTVIDFNMDSDADGDTGRDSGCDSEKEVRFAGFRTDGEPVRNVGDRDTDNDCETDMDVVFDNDIEGTVCFETDVDSDKGLVCNTDDRVAETDVGCDIDNNPELVRDSRIDSDTNVDFSTNS